MLPELKIAQLRHFVWVAELKGFHAAAEKAHRTQPAISLSIKDLENKLGESLFEKRNAKSANAELTPFGQHFLPQAKELIAHHDRIAQDMTLMAEHKTGHLRLASVPSIASRMLPDILSRFVAHAPDLHISCFDDNAAAVLDMVEHQQVDFGIASLLQTDEHANKTFIPLWHDHVGVVCRNDHPLANSDSLHWATLREHRLISNGTSRLLEGTEAAPLLEDSQFYISNMISLVAMLEAGLGVTTLPWFAFPRESSTLTFIPLTTPEVVRRIGIVRLSNKSLSPAAQALVQFILAQNEPG
ncbi:MAG: LysR family transcriptional regulator [Oceanospirillales bacterium]|uniref:LysR family transcriptional regulator n=1 Tax=Marinobacterium halophilum TaxID=267374 RepID=A0A2P8EUS8_9GAMM|nr:LysR family transcriptional regulator [Marinobacterium halophilum]MBR9827304.1 LysR family transcriptional regulator [Oceanospirillales bacterium]PSL13185.1 LysR family transcriptional regulator [Marinobacterium halophilum]